MRRASSWGLVAAFLGALTMPTPSSLRPSHPAGPPMSAGPGPGFGLPAAVASTEVEGAETYLAARPDRGHVLLQLSHRGARPALELRGVRFLRWRGRVDGRDEWLVSAPSSLFAAASVRAHIAAAAPLTPSDRVHPRLLSGDIGGASVTPDGRWKLRVVLADDADVAAASEALTADGFDVRYTSDLPPALVLVAPPEGIDRIAERDDVVWIREFGFAYEDANDENRALCRVDEVQDEGWSGANIRVGIWDSGIPDRFHPDLLSRVVLADTSSVANHPTMVAGTIGGTGTRSEAEGGTPLQWRGMAPSVILYAWDYFTAADSLPVDEMGPGIVRFGLHVANHSYTLGVNEVVGNCSIYGDYDFEAPAYDQLLEPGAHDSVLVVFAAGNERDDGDCGLTGDPYVNYGCIPPPGTAKSVFTIGAVEADLNSMSRFSSWGPTDDGRLKPDLCAPGSQRSVDFGVTSTRSGGDYGTLSGTSFATPTVSGCASLLSEAYIDSVGERPHPNLLKALMINTARDRGRTGPDYRYGHGVLDAARALAALRRGDVYEGVVADQGVVNVPLDLAYAPDSIQVSIVWNDPAGVPLAASALVNDLDLELIAPDVTAHAAWVLDPAAPDAAATRGANPRDVIEQVRVADPMSGMWTIRITGTDVPAGPQPFAIAWQGTVGPCQGTRRVVPFPYATFDAALQAAADCDTVMLGPGTYTGPFQVTKPVVIQGSTIGGGVILTAPDSLRILDVSADATLERLTFRGGRLTAAAGDTVAWTAPDSVGAALAVHGAAIDVRDSRFVGNAASRGGAAWVREATVRFEACVFDSNTAVIEGGAVCADSASVVSFADCTFADNASAGGGGALAGVDAEISGERTHYTRNSGARGGAVWLDNTLTTFTECDFDSNAASGSGGAVHVDSTSTFSLTESLVHHNTASGDGGAFFTRAARVYLDQVTIADNAADSSGGAIYVDAGDSLSVRAVIVAGNTALGLESVDGVRCSGPTRLECVVFWDQGLDSLGCAGGTDLLVADPRFCDRAAADYTLDALSPCSEATSPAGCGRIGSEPVVCGVVAVGSTAPGARFGLGAPRPNPARGAAIVRFDIPERDDVRLRVFDVGGRLVRTLVEARLDAGPHAIAWDGRDAGGRAVSPGVYFYRLDAGSRQISRKLVRIR